MAVPTVPVSRGSLWGSFFFYPPPPQTLAIIVFYYRQKFKSLITFLEVSKNIS